MNTDKHNDNKVSYARNPYGRKAISRRQAIKMGGLAVLGLTFAKPVINTIRPLPAFANYPGMQPMFTPTATPVPQTWQQVAKLLASDGASVDFFGSSMAISGETALVAAMLEDDNGNDSGAAYVFDRNQGGPDNWGQIAKITASDASNGDRFGHSVDVSGETIVVGALFNDEIAGNSGAAYVFERSQGGPDNWGQVIKLTASDASKDDLFGFSVSISGDIIVVGARGDDDVGMNSGSAYVFERSLGGPDNWGQVTKLIATDGASFDLFGYPVAIDGETIVVGAEGNDDAGNSSGSAYIFERNHGGTDNWGQSAKLTASDAESNDAFGRSADVSGDIVIVGAQFDDDNGNNSGSAYIFERNQGGPDNWGQVTKLTASDAGTNDLFGFPVTISGETVLVGAYWDDQNGLYSGSAYIFKRNQGGPDNWGQVTKLAPNDGAAFDEFGRSVAISGDTMMVSAIGDDDNGSRSGSGYVFQLI